MKKNFDLGKSVPIDTSLDDFFDDNISTSPSTKSIIQKQKKRVVSKQKIIKVTKPIVSKIIERHKMTLRLPKPMVIDLKMEAAKTGKKIYKIVEEAITIYLKNKK